MAKQRITISEGLGWLKTLEKRHAELVALRNSNSAEQHRMYGSQETKILPRYDVMALDKQVTLLAREIRLCDTAIKRANASTVLEYQMDDEVLGELS